MERKRRSDDEIWSLLVDALERHPEARVSAVSPDGFRVELPAGLSSRDVPHADADFVLDTISEALHPKLIVTWSTARTDGVASFHGLDWQGVPSTITVFDLCGRCGCLVTVIVAGGWDAPEAHLAPLDRPAPRYCRVVRDQGAVMVELDESAPLLFGLPPEELLGRRSAELVHPDDQTGAIDEWLRMLSAPEQSVRWRGRYRHGDGTWKWIEVTNTNRLHDPAHGNVLSEFVDIGEEIAALDAMRASEELFRQLTLTLPVGVVQFDRHGAVLYTNPAARELFGGAALSSADDVAAAIDEDRRDAFRDALEAVCRDGASHTIEVGVGGTGHRRSVCQIALRALHDADGASAGVIASVADVTESARVREELAIRASYDELTQCHNRASALRELDAVLDRVGSAAVLFVDLDEFKPVNDVHGHTAGDRLLIEVARRLRCCVRSGDSVGRMGGDEFVVMYADVSDRAVLGHLTARLRAALHDELDVGGGTVPMRASVGGVLAVRGDDAEAVVARADAEMYEDKRSRRFAAAR